MSAPRPRKNTDPEKAKKAFQEQQHQLSASSAIFQHLKTAPNQKCVEIDEVILVLQKLLHGVLPAQYVNSFVMDYAMRNGIMSEIQYFNEAEFKEIMNRLIDDWIQSADSDGDGSISKAEFYNNFYEVYGWQAWLAKKYINKTFENVTKWGDDDGNKAISKQEMKNLLRSFAEGTLSAKDVMCMPPLLSKVL